MESATILRTPSTGLSGILLSVQYWYLTLDKQLDPRASRSNWQLERYHVVGHYFSEYHFGIHRYRKNVYNIFTVISRISTEKK